MFIERLHPHHALSYRHLMLEAYELHPESFTSSVSERKALPMAWWESRLEKDAVFGAWDNNELIGVVGLSFESCEKIRHKATLFGLYILPRLRHHGIGLRLIQTVLSHARGCEHIRLVQLTVTEGNRTAQRLYERCGFEVFGIEPMAVAVGATFMAKVHLWQRINSIA